MAVYEVTKKGKVSGRGYFKEVFHIRKKILGIPFYHIDVMGSGNPLPFLMGICLTGASIMFPLIYLIHGFFSLYFLSIAPAWYG